MLLLLAAALAGIQQSGLAGGSGERPDPVASGSAGASPGGPAIRFEGSPASDRFGTVSVTGLPPESLSRLRDLAPKQEDWEALLGVYTGSADPGTSPRPPVLGQYAVEGAGIRFTPRFPLATGIEYLGRFEGRIFDSMTGAGSPATPRAEIHFSMPEPAGESSTRVEAVFPSAKLVPSNLLRLYVHFSGPMRPQMIRDRVRLYDASGREVSLPFVEVKEGLWDPEHTRLTLFFHPGRLKRAVAPNLRLGPPLREGERYRLVIDASLRDATGHPLAGGFEKIIEVGEADRSTPDPREWRLLPPSSPAGPVILDFPEPLDRALMERLIRVESVTGKRIRGDVSITRGETRWSLVPDAPWAPGRYAIRVRKSLEDLAGNSLVHLFEEETAAPPREEPAGGEEILLGFEII